MMLYLARAQFADLIDNRYGGMVDCALQVETHEVGVEHKRLGRHLR